MSGSIAETLKARGNEFFAKGKLDAAIDAYTEAICLEPTQAAYYTNRALCHFKKQRWHQAASDSASALSLEGGSIKGLYLRGASEAELGNFPTAIADLERAIALCKQTAVSYKEDIRRALLGARKRQWEGRRVADEWRVGRCEMVLPGLLRTQLEGEFAQQQTSAGEEARREAGMVVDVAAEALAALKANLGPRPVPDHLCCKISMELMLDPVTAPSGVTYERRCLMEHLSKVGNFDPLTRKPLTIEQVYPNLALREVVDQYLLDCPWAYESSL